MSVFILQCLNPRLRFQPGVGIFPEDLWVLLDFFGYLLLKSFSQLSCEFSELVAAVAVTCIVQGSSGMTIQLPQHLLNF